MQLSRDVLVDDQAITHHDITRLLTENIIEPNTSPWWAQVVVVRDPFR